MEINLLLVAMIELVKFGIQRLVTFSILYKGIKMLSILWLLMFLSEIELPLALLIKLQNFGIQTQVIYCTLLLVIKIK